LGWGRDGRRGARSGCPWWLSDGKHGGVQSSTGAVKQWRRKKRGGAPRWCAPFIATRGGGRRRRKLREPWAENGGSEAVGMGKAVATAVRRRSTRPGHLCSDRVTDRWVLRDFRFFQFIQNQINFKNSKWMYYLASKIPNFCMRLSWDIRNNFLNCADIQLST
jgi:hypothetical protein